MAMNSDRNVKHWQLAVVPQQERCPCTHKQFVPSVVWLFNDAVSDTDYIASGGRIHEWWPEKNV